MKYINISHVNCNKGFDTSKNKGFKGLKRIIFGTFFASFMLCCGISQAQVEVKGNVYGGGNVASVGNSSFVNLTQSGATVDGKLFGGGNAAGVVDSATVKMTTGTVKLGVYGGCNASDTVHGDITVRITGGTVGLSTADAEGVFGGGYGHATSTQGNVTVSLGDTNATNVATLPVIYGDVYGGSALGNVNANNKTTKVDILNVLCHGSVYGGGLGSATLDAHGFVDKTQPSTEAFVYGNVLVNIGVDEQDDDKCLLVIDEDVFGCNNLAGSPKRHVDVHVYKTGHDSKNVFSYHNSDSTFALRAVYGGGNQADYSPNITSEHFRAKVTVHNCVNTVMDLYGGGNAAASEGVAVEIFGGKFDRVFGGGNGAGQYNPGANVGAGGVTIDVHGGYIAHLFGGSNEKGTISGATKVSVTADGCPLAYPTDYPEYIEEFFGGSNLVDMVGNVETTIGCGTKFGSVYGGSNKADITGNITLNIEGGTMDYVYGGSKGFKGNGTTTQDTAANIKDNPATTDVIEGNVTLNLYGGVINHAAFGGSNINGNIDGIITVNVYDKELGCDPLTINDLYGASNQTTYIPVDSTVVSGGAAVKPFSPIVNVMHIRSGASILGSVYGGGNLAAVTSHPHVTIGYADDMSGYLPTTGQVSGELIASVTGNVYGGGNAADVNGNTTMLVQKNNTHVNGALFGGGKAAGVKGIAMGNAKIDMTNGIVDGGVYGGSYTSGTVTGNSTVNIIGGIVGVDETHNANVHGGGYGNLTSVDGDVTVTLGGTTTTPIVYGSIYGGSALGSVNYSTSNLTKVHVKSGTVARKVFGGGLGDLASLATSADPDHQDVAAVVKGNVQVIVDGGVVNRAVYGCNNLNGAPAGTATVTINGGTVCNVVGGGNQASYTAPSGSKDYPQINIAGGEVLYKVIGGGNAADVDGNPIINITDGKIGQHDNYDANTEDRGASGVYGGCNTTGTVTGHTTITATGGTIGSATYKAYGIFGGGYGETTQVTGDVLVTIGAIPATLPTPDPVTELITTPVPGPTVYGDIYGGSALGKVNTDPTSGHLNSTTLVNAIDKTTVDILSGEIHGNVYGGGLGQKNGVNGATSDIEAVVHGEVTVNIGRRVKTSVDPAPEVFDTVGYASFVYYSIESIDGEGNTIKTTYDGDVYGCNNLNGSPQSNVYVNIYGTAHTATDLASYYEDASGRTYAIHNVLGGGNRADYRPENNNTSTSKKTFVKIFGCKNTVEQVYGGSNAAYSYGTETEIEGGRFLEFFGGGNGLLIPANVGLGGVTYTIWGGRFGYIFGGCNRQGQVAGPTTPHDYHDLGNCSYYVESYFCAGNHADDFGEKSYVIDCKAQADDYTMLYAGARLGTIYGNITMTVYGGTFDYVFGGSRGDVTVPANIKRYPTAAQIQADIDQYNAEPDPAKKKYRYPEGIHTFLQNNPTLYGTGGNVTLIIRGGSIKNVFGGCDQAGNVEGQITVIIDDANNACHLDLYNVYGGSNIARYQPLDKTLTSPLVELVNGTVKGNVFGGGYGSKINYEDGVVVANPKVLMGYGQRVDTAHLRANHEITWISSASTNSVNVRGNIYGGGQMASVGGYTRNATTGAVESCDPATGKTTVEIYGGKVGPAKLVMPMDSGMVFGGGLGIVGYVEDEGLNKGNPIIPHLNYVRETDVKILGTAFIKGSVYGGAKNGHVLEDTYVTVSSGQIGCGEDTSDPTKDLDRIYNASEWLTASLAECPHFPYAQQSDAANRYAPYDPFANHGSGEDVSKYPDGSSTEGGRYVADDGHTWYGNVFGGGSGSQPYAAGRWLQSAGAVYGNTHVTVTGGHILTSLYGGNELTDVGTYNPDGTLVSGTGTCTVNFSGGTLGVPRTIGEMADHPVTCYLFGAGKGDQRIFFNSFTNVGNTVVNVTGGWIYGSVFGGGEDGHVVGETSVTVSGAVVDGTTKTNTDAIAGNATKIGTLGTSYVDGNIFGGGRGFSGEALTAGVVCGDINVTIHGGSILGSVYGGGRLASVGTYLVPAGTSNYGKMISGPGHGNVTINIDGGVIGNDEEYVYPTDLQKGSTGSLRFTSYYSNTSSTANLRNRLLHTKGGNVYGGSMGRLFKMDGTTVNPKGPSLGRANSTEVNISGTAVIKSCVYGGGEMGSVAGNTTVNISGGTIGTLVPAVTTAAGHTGGDAYYFGSVYGGGYGSMLSSPVLNDSVALDDSNNPVSTTDYSSAKRALAQATPAILAGRVYGDTYVDVTDGEIFGDIYGGGEMASVGYEITNTKGNTNVNIGATDGNSPPTCTGDAVIHGNVYGANNILGTPFGNTYVNIYKNRRTAKQVVSYLDPDREYAIAKVFGGGHMADYAPSAGSESSDKRANVHVFTCENTIREVFGGGDAASAHGVVTIIEGGRFDRIFGGGNGEEAVANIGQGGTNLTVKAGRIRQLFGGSNLQGSIHGPLVTTLNHANNGSECPEVIGEFYAGSNEAAISGDLTTTIACGSGTISAVYGGCRMANVTGDIIMNIYGGTIGSVYGGSKGVAEAPAVTPVAADITGSIELNLYGGTLGSVHGGSNQNGNITGSIEVTIDSIAGGCDPLTIDSNVYGGGNITMYKPTDGSIISPIVNIKHGTVGRWLTSSEQAAIDAMSAADQAVWYIHHGNVYAGGDGQGSRCVANPTVYMGNGIYSGAGIIALKPVVKGDIYGGGRCSRVFGTTNVNMVDGTVKGSLFGGSKGVRREERPTDVEITTRAIVDGWTVVNMSGGTVAGNIFGGGDLGSVGHLLGTTWSKYESETAANKAKYGYTYVTVSGGTVGTDGNGNGNVFGGGRGLNEATYEEFGRVMNGTVHISQSLGSTTTVTGSVFGGGEYGTVLAGTSVAMDGGTVAGKLFGGGDNAGIGYTGDITSVSSSLPHVDAIGSTGVANTGVTLSGGTVVQGIYGGSNVTGTVTGNSVVALNGGTVATTANHYDVFGGGLGQPTLIKGDVHVTLSGATVYGDIYGGSALGTVNTNATNTTTVDILSGTVNGDIYGGGLGQVDDPATVAVEPTINALVYGKVYVNIGWEDAGSYYGNADLYSYGSSVYGCNNVSGSPQDNVYVNIYGVHRPSGYTKEDYIEPYKTGDVFNENYSIDQVFGGGNKSNYSPTSTQSIYTTIYGCDNTVRRVFGGGNAAHATRISIDIQGGRFGDVFAGGNGEVTAANVTVHLEVGKHGGRYGSFTDGGNKAGTVPLGADYVKDETPGSCGTVTITDYFCGNNAGNHSGKITRTMTCSEGSALNVRNLYGGCNRGYQDGDIEVVIEGGTYENVFGGCKGTPDNPANVLGNIKITIKGGTIGNVFGGCDINGNVTGTIEVNIDSALTGCPFEVDNVYGGGNYAAYKPTTPAAYATVNVKSGTIGRALTPAETTAYNALSTDADKAAWMANWRKTHGNVFGGGKGESAVFCQQEICNGGDPTCDNTTPCNSTPYGPVVNIGDNTDAGKKAIVKGNVYGGGDLAKTNGSSTIAIVKGNTVVHGDVFGGANQSNLSRGVTVTIGTNGASEGPDIFGSVYGGGALGDVTCSTSYVPAPEVNVTLYKGHVYQNIFGGGLGQKTGVNGALSDIASEVNSPVQVSVYSGKVDGAVYGCNNINGSPESTVNVDIYGSDNVDNAIAQVFGGGNMSAYAPMGTYAGAAPIVTIHNNATSGLPKIGTVYGGGNAAQVPATSVTVYGGTVGTVYGGGNGELVEAPVEGNSDVNINGGTIGTVFGGNNNSGNIGGAITVDVNEQTESGYTACAATVGTIYGGGNLATYTPTSADARKPNYSPFVTLTKGKVTRNVYGGGKGSATNVLDGLITMANPKVLMNPTDISHFRVDGDIYGGGEMATVGDFNRNVNGKPTTLKASHTGTGITTVVITGGKVGKASMSMTAVGGPDDCGHVFGAGKGIVGDPTVNTNIPNLNYVDSASVIIGGTALVKGSVFGGSEAGHVLRNTHVTIQEDCQIGAGYTSTDLDRPYTTAEWNLTSLFECSHFPYGYNNTFYVYDPNADADGNYDDGVSSRDGRPDSLTGSGATFYGNVFGGGSGYYAYRAKTATNKDTAIWLPTSGAVEGNTYVDITGGHILTSAYGGNEISNVEGDATVNFGGTATLGVPRTLAQIAAHPVTCYLFGAGKGDPRLNFNTVSNVRNVVVNVDGGKIYGSVFGGGEDGHVTGNVEVNIMPGADIGTQGLSYVDGNVFGGGRGFNGTALTAGTVCGNITVNITGGTMLGSVYGGGRLGSVGTYLAPESDANYGKLQPGDNHGIITVYISGGTIGSTAPYVYFEGTKPADLANSYYDDNNILTRTTSGNVFGGSMGRATFLTGEVNLKSPNLAKAKRTSVNISGSTTRIYGSVYGASELGTVSETATVSVTGGTIGSIIEPATDALKTSLNHALQRSYNYADYDESTHTYSYNDKFTTTRYHYGSVYGGGYGLDMPITYNGVDCSYTPEMANAPTTIAPIVISGRVFGSTSVSVTGGQVYENVFGGGNLASVGKIIYDATSHQETGYDGGLCSVTIGGTAIIGPLDYTAMNGYVYGAGKGVGNDPDDETTPAHEERYREFCNVGSTRVTVNGGRVWGSVFGGGADAHVLGNTDVTIQDGANIGIDGTTTWDGNVFGGGRNFLNTNHTAGRVGGNVTVTVDGGIINGSIFGGGRLALTGIDVDGGVTAFTDGSGNYDSENHGKVTVNVSGGTIGFHGDVAPKPAGWTLLTGSDESIGDIYGSGKGDTKEYLDIHGGRTMNTYINITGNPEIHGSVFGGGEMAGIGWWNESTGVFVNNTGSSTVSIKGTPVIGTALEHDRAYMLGRGDNAPSKWTVFDTNAAGHRLRLAHTCTGNVFGASMGDVDTNSIHWISFARSRTSSVTIEGGTIMHCVYGGAEQGVVMEDASVVIKGGTIGSILKDSLNTDYNFGSVFGGGYGSTSYTIMTDDDADVTYHPNTANDSNRAPVHIAGRVYGNTYVSIEGGNISRNVYGGGEMASVGYVNGTTLNNGNCEVRVTGGNIGYGAVFASPIEAQMICGHVFGGTKGLVGKDLSGQHDFSDECNVNTTNVIIGTAGELVETPIIRGSVFGGSENGHVLDTTLVEVKNGLIGAGVKYTGNNEYINNYAGNVYGGGSGIETDINGKMYLSAGQVDGATHVKFSGGRICSNLYGGGSMATVGVGITNATPINKIYKNIPRTNKSGRAWVEVTGGVVGIYMAPTGSEGNWTANDGAMYSSVFGGGRGLAGHDLMGKVDYSRFGYVTNSIVEIKYPTVDAEPTGTNHIVGNVFGGGNNGHVKNSTYVVITGGRIGSDGNKGFGGLEGNVFGGGNGYDKYTAYVSKIEGDVLKYYHKNTNTWTTDTTGALLETKNSPTSGLVYGDCTVIIGKDAGSTVNDLRVMHHVYGGGNMGSVGDYWYHSGNVTPEAADGHFDGEIYAQVKTAADATLHDGNTEPTGKCTVTINGGTLGTTGGNNGMVFGGCRGDIGAPETLMDSVAFFYSTNVTIGKSDGGYTNPLIYGSVYGGGENGHCVQNTAITINGGRIGSNNALYNATKAIDDELETLETVTMVNELKDIAIKEDSIIIYRKANAATPAPDASVIAHNNARVAALQSQINTLKTVTYKTHFDRRDELKAEYDANIKILSFRGNVYGGGCGTDKYDTIVLDPNSTANPRPALRNWNNTQDSVQKEAMYNPLAGVVYGNTTVTINGGYVERNVYGGGAMANVGRSVSLVNHNDFDNQFALSWPVNTVFRTGTGIDTVTIGGTARIGFSGSDNGDIFGGARGEAGRPAFYNRFANVSDAIVTINIDMPAPSGGYVVDKAKKVVKDTTSAGLPTYPLVAGSVYGGAENGLVNHNTTVTLTNGVVGHALYGGGKGKGKYKATLKVPYTDQDTEKEIYGICAGRVLNNCTITVNGGHVVRNVYGGGNMGSVGKGNYAGGTGDYYPPGYGEKWAYLTRDEATHDGHPEYSTKQDAEESGFTILNINAGTIGTPSGMKDDLPTGNVFGGGRGTVVSELVTLSPRWLYVPEFYASYVNSSVVTIGDDGTAGPTIYGSVFGGGQDGHVRFNTHVTVKSGEIGLEYNAANQELLAKVYDKDATTPLDDMDDVLWYARGNVFGGGSGLGKLNDGNYGNSSGSVTEFTTVDILGGTIHRNVYGGGNIGSVGQPMIPWDQDGDPLTPPTTSPEPTASQSLAKVNIGKSGAAVNSATVGDAISVAEGYGGDVYGSSRGGDGVGYGYAKTVHTEVNINQGAHVLNNVYGGGEMGYVRQHTNVNVNDGTVDHMVLGGGKGLVTDPGSANVRGNATVTMIGGNVVNTIFGGGELASVGTFTGATAAEAAADPSFEVGEPYSCAAGTGLTKVIVSGGRVGKTTAQNMIQLKAGTTDEYETAEDDDVGYVFGAGMGVYSQPGLDNPLVNNNISKLGYVDNSEVTIDGTALIMGAVWGGSENGQVLHNTTVYIKGGQIGCGEGKTAAYTDSEWSNAIAAVTSGSESDIASAAAAMPECAHFQYQSPYLPYDAYADEDHLTDASTLATDGHTFFGNVFAGGSGYYPYRLRNYNNTKDTSVFRASQGRVRGNTRLEISGGHILTSAYGGSEYANVYGDSSVVIMTGGTIGLPRTEAQIAAHPVTCYLFGAGKGDQRLMFNQWTNVNNVRVEVKGGTIFGSVFGGGEDGHIEGGVVVNISQAAGKTTHIGTRGISYVDGNVFGGGRGFSGDALTAGNVRGNATVNISGGTMLGTIYGGGRLGSVGYGLYMADDDVNYGKILDGDDHGIITVNITGGTIGNDVSSDYNKDHPRGGNVFGGSMGRLEKLGSSFALLDEWQRLGSAKKSTVNISGTALVKGNVYGGSELGTLSEGATVTISGGTIGVEGRKHGNVYGGGYGNSTLTASEVADATVRERIATYAGRTYGDTRVDILDGTVYGSIYGGGEMASVGDATKAAQGNTLVNIGKNDRTGNATIKGEVFGCNNIHGTPLGNVDVHIYKTFHPAGNGYTTGDCYPSTLKAVHPDSPDNVLDTLDVIAIASATPKTLESGWEVLSNADRFALEGVYGGGNQASYAPVNSSKKSTVTVHYCDENSIYRVYGGGKGGTVAPVNHTEGNVIIEGGHIYQVFAGGNGEGTGNQGANVTKASVTVKGGIVQDVFGGSNTKGTVAQSSVNFEPETSCDILINQVFGGGNRATGEGEIVVNIPCGQSGIKDVYGCGSFADFTGNVTLNVLGGTMNRVFGGAREANVHGNVTVNVFAGDINEVFGGNNIGGYIFGDESDNKGFITVNVDLANDMCPAEKKINFVYGGGNDAPYQPEVTGYTSTDGIYSFTSATFGYSDTRESPVVNIISGTIDTAVFGGGKGTGHVTSNPKVVIGAERLQEYDPVTKTVKSIAPVTNLDVNIGTGVNSKITSLMGNVFGGGNAAQVNGNTMIILQGDKTKVWNNVYGGGNSAKVTGNTVVNVK